MKYGYKKSKYYCETVGTDISIMSKGEKLTDIDVPFHNYEKEGAVT